MTDESPMELDDLPFLVLPGDTVERVLLAAGGESGIMFDDSVLGSG